MLIPFKVQADILRVQLVELVLFLAREAVILGRPIGKQLAHLSLGLSPSAKWNSSEVRDG